MDGLIIDGDQISAARSISKMKPEPTSGQRSNGESPIVDYDWRWVLPLESIVGAHWTLHVILYTTATWYTYNIIIYYMYKSLQTTYPSILCNFKLASHHRFCLASTTTLRFHRLLQVWHPLGPTLSAQLRVPDALPTVNSGGSQCRVAVGDPSMFCGNNLAIKKMFR